MNVANRESLLAPQRSGAEIRTLRGGSGVRFGVREAEGILGVCCTGLVVALLFELVTSPNRKHP